MKIITIKGKRYLWNYKRTIAAAAVVTAITAGGFVLANQAVEKVPKVYGPEDSIAAHKLFPVPVIADVPLDAQLQNHIWNVSEDYGLDPKLVLAVIGQESCYQCQKIGDDGESVGLMQVQEKYHEERMDRLGCDNLLDPYQNVIVGVDYLAECIKKGGLEWGLMCYNGGPDYADEKVKQGIKTEYVESVLYSYETMR